MALSVAIIGAGVIGKRLSQDFHKNKVNIKWICDLDIEKAKDLAIQYESKSTSNFNDVLNDSEVDIVYIGVPPRSHYEIARSALNSGKHVLCEKPLAYNVKQGEEMVKAASESNLITCVNFVLRFEPGIQELISLLRSHHVGNIKRIELKFRFPHWPRQWQQNEWLEKRDQGGPIREVASHFIFLMHEFSNYIGQITHVWSKVDYSSEVDCEHSALGIIKLSTGIECLFDLLVRSPEQEENTLKIIGEERVLSFEGWRNLYEIHPNGSKSLIKLQKIPETTVSTFLDKVNDTETRFELVQFYEGLRTQIVIDTILKSEEKWIDLNSV